MRQPPKNDQTSSQTSARMQVAATSPERPEGRRLAFRRLRLHQRFVPLLIAVTLLSTVSVTACAYLGARADAISTAQAQATQDVQVERQILAQQGPAISLNNNQLQVGVDNAVHVLNNDTTVVDTTHSVVNANATIYQLEGDRLVAIATNLPQTSASGNPKAGTRALGDALTGAAVNALLGDCGPTDTRACHHTYSGVVSAHGVSYVAAYAPLYDMSGQFVGALSAAIPLDSVVAPTIQLVVLLAFVGLLVALVSLAGGFWVFGALSRGMLDTLDQRLHIVAENALDLEQAARKQMAHASRQERLARQASEQARALNALADTLEKRSDALQQSAGGIWNEFSQPGLPVDAAAALQLARQAAVTSAEVGSTAEETTDLCRQLVTLMNHMIAEGASVTDGGRELEQHARELRGCVEGVESAVGERIAKKRPQGLFSLPLLRQPSVRLKQLFGAHTEPDTAEREVNTETTEQERPFQITSRQPNTQGQSGAEPRQTGYQPRVGRTSGDGASGGTGQFPRVHPGASNQFRQRHATLGDTAYGRSVRPGSGSGAHETGEWRTPGGSSSADSYSARSPMDGLDGRGMPASSTPRGGASSSGSFGGAFDSLQLPRLPDDDPGAWNRRLLDRNGDQDGSGSR